jgi:hypothetical protein
VLGQQYRYEPEHRCLRETGGIVPQCGVPTSAWTRREQTDDPVVDPATLERCKKVAEEWKRSVPRLEGGPYPDVARVPPGGLEKGQHRAASRKSAGEPAESREEGEGEVACKIKSWKSTSAISSSWL